MDYLRAAREAGAHDAMKPAIGILVFGYWDVLVARARLKLPPSDVEEVASETIASAIASAFDGKSVGEFRSWLHTILSQADRRPPGGPQAQAEDREAGTEHGGSDDVWGDEPAEGFEGDALFASDCITRGLRGDRERRPPAGHRPPRAGAAVGGGCRDRRSATGMSEANVHQVASRFRKRFRELFDEGDTSV